MSRKLLHHRGRYPKDASLYQSSTPIKQEHDAAASPMGTPYLPTGDVQTYNPQLGQQANQSTENLWHLQQQQHQIQPKYFGGNVPSAQHQQLPPQNSWHDDSYYSARPPENSVWNWMPENTSHSSNPQMQPQHQHIETQQASYMHQPQNDVNTCQVYTQVQQAVSYAPQNSWYSENINGSRNQNGNQHFSDFQHQQSSWEAIPQNISHTEHLPWTYNVPQTVLPQSSQAAPELSAVKMPSGNSGIQNWSEAPVSNSGYDASHPGQLPNHQAMNYLPQPSTAVEHSQGAGAVYNAVGQCNSESSHQLYVYNESNVEDLGISPTLVNPSTVPCSKENSFEQEHDNRGLAVFFQHSNKEEEGISHEPPTANKMEDGIQDSQSGENHVLSEIYGTEAPVKTEASVKIEAHQTYSEGDHQIGYVNNAVRSYNDVIHEQIGVPDETQPSPTEKPSLLCPDLSVEEPPNQEVPGPNDSIYASAAAATHVAKQTQQEESFDEPQNQQVPVECSAVPAGGVVQQESDELKSFIRSVDNVEETRIQEVNLETVPDNLERPPDHDELKKKSSWHSSLHRHHLRSHNDSMLSLSSASLWDSPDIPHITLAPAAPLPSVISTRKSPSEVQDAVVDSVKASSSSISKHSANETPLNSNSTESENTTVFSSRGGSPSTDESSHVSEKNSPVKPVQNQESGDGHCSRANDSLEKHQKEERVYRSQNRESASPPPTRREPVRKNSLPDSENSEQLHHYHESRGSGDARYYRSMDQTPLTTDYDQSSQNYKDRSSRDRREENYRDRFAENRFSSFEAIGPENERSRPSSRMSLNETSEHYREQNSSKHYASDNERPSSRMSESGTYRAHESIPRSYHNRHNVPYYGDEDYYRHARAYAGYDYDPYQVSRTPYYGYYDPYRYGYSRYNYGYHDELYRNDPRYRQQVDEQYREYYRRYGYDTDYERSSAPSGRSSATELSKDVSQRYPDSERTSDLQYSQHSYGYTERQSQFSSFEVLDDQQSIPAARLTPAKFSSVHAFANFSGTGQLITLIPKQASCCVPPLVEIHDMQAIFEKLESFEELKSFPGPLVRGETHKNDLIDFCLQKVKFYKQKDGIPDRDSYILLWELLVLLLRQNGSVAGSDIAELLLKGHEVLRPLHLKLATDTPQGDCSPVDGGECSSNVQTGDTSSPDEGIVVTRDKTILNNVQNVDVDKVTRKFREFLLFGHKKDALEWAMKHALWGHALFLASKMDLRTYANVMTRFANSLALNDPLQTLYQLMSGRQPAAVTCITDKHWGDWRPHLAMILSNPSAHSEVDMKSITTLGDTLAAQGCLPAAHFCYLMAQVDFGTYSQKSSKLVLLCADHRLPFNEFATNETIQCTEIYEYAQSLANPGFMLNHLQVYKFIYATRLLDHGFMQEALHYCEMLSSNFLSNTESFSVELMSQIYELASKLKYNDPHYLQGQGELEEQDDPEWLHNLGLLVSRLQVGNTDSPTVAYGESSSYTASNVGTHSQEVNGAAPLQVPSADTSSLAYHTPQIQQNYYQNSDMWNANSNVLQQQQVQPDLGIYRDIPMPQQAISPYQPEPSSFQWNLNSQKVQESQSTEPSTDQHSPPPVAPPVSSVGHNFKRFDFYGNDTQQVQSVRPSNRERTSSTSSIGFQRDRHDSTISSGSEYGAGNSAAVTRKANESQKAEEKAEKPRSQVGQSWLGGIFSRLLPKAPNQMILPDDKNPTIVWDPVMKKWVNSDSNEEDESIQPMAPPTDSELMIKNPLENTISSMAPVAAVSMPIGNKFQRPKVKGMRQNYVDVLNSGSTTTKTNPPANIMFPVAPMQQNPAQVFVPSAPVSEDAPIDFVSTGQPLLTASQDGSEDSSEVIRAPPMFDPAEFESRRSSINSIRHSVGPARRTYPT